MMQSLQQDRIDRQRRIERASKMTPKDRFCAGEELFAAACNVTLAGIRFQFPDSNEEQTVEILKHRLKLQREREDRQLAKLLNDRMGSH